MTRRRPDYADKVQRLSIDPAPKPGLPPAVPAIDLPPPKMPRWIVQEFWPAGEIGLFVGDGGTFKSSVALHVAAAIAGGQRVFNRYETTQRPVIIVSAEDDQDTVMIRLSAFVRGHGWDRRTVLSNVHLMCTGEPSVSDPKWRAHLIAEADRLQPGFLLLDPWAELLGADENSNTEARPAIKYLRALARRNETAIGIVHHAGKAHADRRTLDRIRGASALPSAARCIYFFDWHNHAIEVENLKQSRGPRLDSFVVDAIVTSDPKNRARWDVAQLSTKNAHVFRANNADRWVIEQLWHQPNTLGTTDLRNLRSQTQNPPSAFELTASLKRLEKEGYLSYQSGKQGKKFFSLTGSGYAYRERLQVDRPRARAGEETPSPAPIEATAPTGVTGAQLEWSGEPTETLPDASRVGFATNERDPTDPTQRLPGQGSEAGDSPLTPIRPPKGGDRESEGSGSVSSAGNLGNPEDLIAELDERLGLEEDR